PPTPRSSAGSRLCTPNGTGSCHPCAHPCGVKAFPDRPVDSARVSRPHGAGGIEGVGEPAAEHADAAVGPDEPLRALRAWGGAAPPPDGGLAFVGFGAG